MSMHSLANEIDTQLKSLILDTANNNPAPKVGIIHETSADNCYANVQVDGGILNGIECFGFPKVGTKCILIFIDGNKDNMICLCNPLNMKDYTEDSMLPHYNVLINGAFTEYKNNKFTNWTGGTLNSTDYKFKNQSCEIKPNTTLISDKIKLDYLRAIDNGDNTAVCVSLFWKGGSAELTCYDQDDKEIVYTPYNMGISKETLEETSDWHFQRVNFVCGLIDTLTITIKNNSPKSTIVDGIRVWLPDDMETWYPCNIDK